MNIEFSPPTSKLEKLNNELQLTKEKEPTLFNEASSVFEEDPVMTYEFRVKDL